MEQPSPWYFGFEEYERIGEPHKKQKSFAWTTAIGLQAVDGLSPSKYLLETARRNIEGEISIQEANKIIDDYYKTNQNRKDDEQERTEEADKVSARIAEILNDGTFTFKPTTLQNIHKKLFKGIYKFAGKIRDYNISKKEWILDGDSVYYADYTEIAESLKYDFDAESNFDYSGISRDDFIKHFSKFISDIWQVHAFGDAQAAECGDLNNFHSCKRREATYGNTRTTAVFAIKYLGFLGYETNNEPFVQNSWYFRNSLVRANYNSSSKGIKSDKQFLELFFRNLLLGEKNELKNRHCHIYWKSGDCDVVENVRDKFGINLDEVRDKFGETALGVLQLIMENNKITLDEIAEKMNLTRRTIEKKVRVLREAGVIARVGANKNGWWKVYGF